MAVALELPEPSSQASRHRLAELVQCIVGRVVGPIEWLTRDDLGPYRKPIELWSQWSRRYGELVATIEDVHGAGWRAVPPEILERLRRAKTELYEIIGHEPVWNRVLELASSLRKQLAAIRQNLEAIRAPLGLLRTALGLDSRGDSLAELEEVTAIARLSQRRHRPPGLWLSRARLADAESFLLEHGPAYRAQRDAYEELIGGYDPNLFDLDLDPLCERMRRWHGHWWNRIRPTHRADRRALAAVTRTRVLASSIVAGS